MSMRRFMLWAALGLGASPALAAPEAQAPQPARADIVLFTPRATNLEPALADALGDAVEQALRQAMPDAALVGPAAADARLGTTGTPEATARSLGAEMWITVRAIRLDTVAEVVVTRHRPGLRPVSVRAPLPPVEALPEAALGWMAQLMAAPEADPPPPLPADAPVNDQLSWGLRAGGVWSIDAVSQPLVDLAAELHSRSGRWFMAGSIGGRLPVTDDPTGRYWAAGARLRSGLYAGSGPVWPAVWLGLEPRMVVGDGGAQFGLMPVIGVGLDLTEIGPARLSIDAEAGYNMIDLATALPGAPPEEGADGEGVAPEAGPQPIEIGLVLGVSW